MILKTLQKKLDLDWINKHAVLDVVVYGSFIRGKSDAKDIDIAVILPKQTSAAKKLELSQELRHMLSSDGVEIDVIALAIGDFEDPAFLNRQAILSEGYSLVRNDFLAQRFGFRAVTIFLYSLKGLRPSKQKIFYYVLQGRKKGTGILSRRNGRILSKGILEVSTQHSEEIKKIMELHGVSYTIIQTLQY